MAASRSLGTLTLDLIAKIGGFEQGMDRAARTSDRKGREISAAARKRAKETEEAWANVGTAIGAVFSSIAVGAILIVLAVTGQIGLWGWIGIVPILTGTLRWCPAYLPFGLSTCKTR